MDPDVRGSADPEPGSGPLHHQNAEGRPSDPREQDSPDGLGKHGASAGEASEPSQPIMDAREARDRHRRRTPPTSGSIYLSQISRDEFEWLRGMAAGVARSYNIDPDDLVQELILRIASSNVLDAGRRGYRGWMKQCAKWRAADMLRTELSRKTDPHPPEELVAVAEEKGAETHDVDAEWDPRWLSKVSLSPYEVRVVQLILWGMGSALRSFAELVGRSYDATRQDKSRAVRKIRELFELEPEEHAAFVALREYGSSIAAAARLGIEVDELLRRVRRAEKKIHRVLGTGRARDERSIIDHESEDDSDVL